MMFELNSQDIEKQINDTKSALMKLKEVEKHLQDMKRKIEIHALLISECLKRNDNSSLARLKQEYNIISSYNEIEKYLLSNVGGPSILTILNPVKDTVDKKTFMKHQSKLNLSISKQHFYEEFSQGVVKDSQVFRVFKNFFGQYLYSGDGIEFQYSYFKDYLNFGIPKHNWILARFSKDSKLDELPEIFHETIIRTDLITVTFTFRKTAKSKNTGDVFLHKIIYSNLFDKKAKNYFQKEHDMSNIQLQYANQGQVDPDVSRILKLIQKNTNKVCLPCTYPNLYLFQFFSNQVMEKVERSWKQAQSTPSLADKTKITSILENILKSYPEALHFTMQQPCGICKKMMKCDTHTQKLLPCIWIEFDKNTPKMPIHHPCAKIQKFGKEIDEPKIILNFDIGEGKEEDEVDVNKFFN